MMGTELIPRYDSRKSFYGKAMVEYFEEKIELTSYNTMVAYIFKGELFVKGWFSATTARHINEFAQQNGFSSMTKKQMEYHWKERSKW